MNILILSTKMPWPPRDGGAIATLNLAVGLAQNGADVTLLTMNTEKHYFPPDQIPDNIRDLIHIISVDVNTRIRPLKLLLNFLFSSYPYIAERFISKQFQSELQTCLEKTPYDIVQIEGPYLGYYKQFIGETPLLSLRAHNLEHRIWELRAVEEKNLIRQLYLRSLSRRVRKLEQRLLAEIDLLVPISKDDAEGFSKLGHELPFMECPAGIDIAKYPFSKPQNEIRLFYIGALDWAPNQEGLDWFFAKVWPVIHSRWPELVLHVAGRNSSRYFTANIPENVYPEGEIDDAIPFFNNHNVMIVPLLSGSGIRVKILEAMAMGKVVISSAIGASGLNAINGEHLFIADSADDYIRILETLHEHASIIRETGHQARQFVTEKFDNLVLSKKLISFYKTKLK